MKKYLLCALLVCFAVFSAVYANGNSLTLTGSPYGMQFVSTTINTNHTQNYGFGFEAEYRHSYSTFEFGGDLAYYNFIYDKSHITAHLGNLRLLAKAGAKFSLSEVSDIRASIGPGLSLSVSRSGKNINFIAGLDVEYNYRLSELFFLAAGVDVTFEITKSKDSDYGSNVWSVAPSIGAGISF